MKINEQKKKASKEVATDKNEVRRIWEPFFYMKVEDVDEWFMHIFVLFFSFGVFESKKNHASSSQAKLQPLKTFWSKSSCVKCFWDEVQRLMK